MKVKHLTLLFLLCFACLCMVSSVYAQDDMGQQQQVTQSAVYLIPDYELYFLFAVAFGIGFAPLFLMLIRCPEALTFIGTQLFGGILIESSDDSGIIEFKRARPYGKEGQYITGADRFGKRTVYVVPRLNGKDLSKRYILKGIRRVMFDHYGGKTGIANKEMLAAIEVSEFEEKTKLPENVASWAKENNIETTTMFKDVKGESKIKVAVEKLFTLDSRKLRQYFSDYFDTSQFDGLLQQKYIQGVNFGRGGKKGGSSSWIIIVVVVLIVAAVAILIAMKTGIIK